MSAFIEFLATNGYPLLLATAVLLAVGSLAMILHRSPGHRQRIGEAAIAATLILIALAVLPLPRSNVGSWIVSWEGSNDDGKLTAVDSHSDHVAPVGSSNQTNDLASTLPAATDTTPDLVTGDSEDGQSDIGASTSDFGPALPLADGFGESDADLSPIVGATLGNDVALEHLKPHNKPIGEARSATNREQSAIEAGPLPFDATDLSSSQPESLTTPGIRSSQESDARSTFAWVFLTGSLACCAWLLLGRLQLWRLARSAKTANEAILATTRAALNPRTGSRVRVMIAERCPRPVTFGIFRPVIILPASLCRASSAAALAHVLRHECAHINRRDAVGQLLTNLALPLLWVHPLYWFIRIRIRMDAELMADDWAAGQSSPVEYVEQLVQLVRRRRGLRLATVGGLGLFGSQSQFTRRMEMLMKRSTRLPARCSSLWKSALLVLFCTAALIAADAVGGRQAAAQRNDDQAHAEMSRRLENLLDVVAKLEAQTAEAMAHANDQKARANAAEQKLADMAAQLEQVRHRNAQNEQQAANRNAQQADNAAAQMATLQQTTQRYSDDINKLKSVINDLQQENAVLRNELEHAKAAGGPPNPSENEASKQADPFAANPPVNAGDPLVRDAASKDLPTANSPFANSQPTALSSSAANSGTDIDILGLATAIADGVGNLRKAEINLAHLRRSVAAGASNEADVQIAEIEFETQRNKLELYRSLAEVTLESAHSRLEALKEQFDHTAKLAAQGFVTDGELRLAKMRLEQAESRVRVVERLLSQ